MGKPGTMIYFDVLPALDQLPPAAVGELLLGVLHYAQDGREPSFTDESISFAWPFLKSAVDRDNERYEEKQIRSEWLVYCRTAKRDGIEALDFQTWRERCVNATLPTPTPTPTPAPAPTPTPAPTPAPTPTPTIQKADKPPAPPLLGTNFGPELNNAFSDWLQYKQEKRQGYKPKGLQSLVTQIEKQAAVYGEGAVASLIVECMSNGWQGIIWDRLEKQQPQKVPQGQTARKSWEELAREMEENGEI